MTRPDRTKHNDNPQVAHDQSYISSTRTLFTLDAGFVEQPEADLFRSRARLRLGSSIVQCHRHTKFSKNFQIPAPVGTSDARNSSSTTVIQIVTNSPFGWNIQSFKYLFCYDLRFCVELPTRHQMMPPQRRHPLVTDVFGEPSFPGKRRADGIDNGEDRAQGLSTLAW